MAANEEPLKKKREFPIVFGLCLLCQGDTFTYNKGQRSQIEHLRKPELESYRLLFDCIKSRAQYGNTEYARLHQQLSDKSPEELNKQRAMYHKSCYAKATHKQHIKRDKVRYDKAISFKESSVLSYSKVGGRPPTPEIDIPSTSSNILTRCRYPPFQNKHCFYSQSEKIAGGTAEHLVTCQSSDIGMTITEIVDASGNEQWTVNLADVISESDLLSRDIKYHKSCQTANWRKYIQVKERHRDKEPALESTEKFISVEIEFSAKLQDSLDQGIILTLSEVATRYNNMMRDHSILNQQITRVVLLNKLAIQISNFAISEASGSKPAVIHSKEIVRSAVDSALEERDVREDMMTIFRCSKLIRQSILRYRQVNPWTFNGSLTNCEEQSLPTELVTMMRWTLQGAKCATTDARAKELKN